MQAIDTNRAGQIITLHNEVIASAVTTIEKAIDAGRLLTEQKAELPHGQFTRWIEDHLPFTPRTARNYMGLYNRRDLIKTETVSDLSGAYKLLKLQDAESKRIEKINSLYSGLVQTFGSDEAVCRFTDSLVEIINRNKKEL